MDVEEDDEPLFEKLRYLVHYGEENDGTGPTEQDDYIEQQQPISRLFANRDLWFQQILQWIRTQEIVVRFGEDFYCLASAIPKYKRSENTWWSTYSTASSSMWPPPETTLETFPAEFQIKLRSYRWPAHPGFVVDDGFELTVQTKEYARDWPCTEENVCLDWCETREWHAARSFPAALLGNLPMKFVHLVYCYAYKFA